MKKSNVIQSLDDVWADSPFVATSGTSFQITRHLHCGAVGDIYEIVSLQNKGRFALKAVSLDVEDKLLLHIELRVMQLLKEANSQNCCVMVDKGNTPTFNYIVMKLVGQSLQDMKKVGPNKHMSTGCALSVSIQCLNALKELHDVGFLHRDIKPGNYAVGQEEKGTPELRRCYLLDFGMCKPWRGLRDNTTTCMGGKFRGSPRYAPLASHKLAEHARKDDLESWFYMLVDFCNAALPWKVATDLPEIGRIKEECRRGSMMLQMMSGVPHDCIKMLEHLDSLSFSSDPDYAYMTKIMRDCITNGNLKEFPYDWEPSQEPATPVTKSLKRIGCAQKKTAASAEKSRPQGQAANATNKSDAADAAKPKKKKRTK